MRINSHRIVAIVLAVSVGAALVGSGEVVHFMVGMSPEESYTMSPEIMAAWEKLALAVVVALSGYMAWGIRTEEKRRKKCNEEEDEEK